MMYRLLLHFFKSVFVASLEKFNSTFTLPPKDFCSGKYSLIYTVFFIDPIIKQIIVSFPFKILFITFSLYYFFNSKLFLICFLQFIFVKRYNLLSIKNINNICPQHSIFNFFNPKTSSYQFGV